MWLQITNQEQLCDGNHRYQHLWYSHSTPQDKRCSAQYQIIYNTSDTHPRVVAWQYLANLAGHKHSQQGYQASGPLCVLCRQQNNNYWCLSANIIKTWRCLDIEYLASKCRPFYTLHEFSIVLIPAVYIPSHANTQLVLEELQDAINRQIELNAHTDGALIIAGNFNLIDLKSVMPRLHKMFIFPYQRFHGL